MAGMCKANQRQNGKRKGLWQARAAGKSFEVHKKREIEREKHRRETRKRQQARRAAKGKKMRGHARKQRRVGLQRPT